MIEHGPAVSYIDAIDDNASTIYISRQVEELLGYSPREWIEDPELWPNLLHPMTGLVPWPRTSGTTRPASRSAWSIG